MFLAEPCLASLVRMRDDMLLVHNQNEHEHDLASSWLCDANHDHGYILITLMGSVTTNSSVSSEAKIESMEEYSEAS